MLMKLSRLMMSYLSDLLYQSLTKSCWQMMIMALEDPRNMLEMMMGMKLVFVIDLSTPPTIMEAQLIFRVVIYPNLLISE